MGAIRFSDFDASILYCIPKPASTLQTIIHCYTFIERVAVPSFDDLSRCLGKAFQVGIVKLVDGKILVTDNWYRQIHQADDTASNEIESLLEFAESLCDKEWEVASVGQFIINRNDYDDAVRQYKKQWS